MIVFFVVSSDLYPFGFSGSVSPDELKVKDDVKVTIGTTTFIYNQA